MELLPDEAKGLPPPDILNRNSAWFGLVGWFSAMLHNGLNRRPALRSGEHVIIHGGFTRESNLLLIKNMKM